MPYRIVDAYPPFRECWERAGSNPERLLEAWEREYMSMYPELLRLQVENYESMGVDWREVARERVFPKLKEALPRIEEAHRNLLEVIPGALEGFRSFWNRDFDVTFVIYVGIGCGAGWAAEYGGRYAVLLGLENIAELEWQSKEDLEGLILHELSHIAHMALRGVSAKEFERLEEDPLFLLYSEGFATRCEELMLGREMRRIARDESWLEWCRDNLGFLASEYLRRVEENEPVNDFFGSWLSVEGRSQVGYYMGHEFVRSLEGGMSLEEIAVMSLEDVRRHAERFLGGLASTR